MFWYSIGILEIKTKVFYRIFDHELNLGNSIGLFYRMACLMPKGQTDLLVLDILSDYSRYKLNYSIEFLIWTEIRKWDSWSTYFELNLFYRIVNPIEELVLFPCIFYRTMT